jgi:hypothetical protein
MSSFNIIGYNPGTTFIITPAERVINVTDTLIVTDQIPPVQHIQTVTPIVKDKIIAPYKVITNIPPSKINGNEHMSLTKVRILDRVDVIRPRTHNVQSVPYKIIANQPLSQYNLNSQSGLQFSKTIITNVI